MFYNSLYLVSNTNVSMIFNSIKEDENVDQQPRVMVRKVYGDLEPA